jgi:hypothetical protein
METNIENDINIDENWYYAVIQDPGTSVEQFVGYRDEETDSQFLPVFKTKQEAQKCFKQMPKDLFNAKYEAQAIIEEDLFKLLDGQNYKIYLLDEKGTIVEELGNK